MLTAGRRGWAERGAVSRALGLVRAAIALVLAAPAAARAQDYVRTIASQTDTSTVCLAWSRRDYEYKLNQSGSARTPGDLEFAALDEAFRSWQAVSDTCSDFQFIRGPRTAKRVVGRDTGLENLIVFRERSCDEVVAPEAPCFETETCGNEHGCWEHGASTIALTTSSYVKKTGVVSDSDIEFNGAFWFTAVDWPPCVEGAESDTCIAYDIQNVATHEIGHVVGLAHVVTDDSTMAPTAPIGEKSKRVIDPGTQAGFCSIYPRDAPPVPCDDFAAAQVRLTATSVGVPGCSEGCGGSSAAVLGWGGLVGLAWPRRRRTAPRR